MALPEFLVKKLPKRENIRRLRALIDDPGIHTVCEEASCPNIGECFSQKTCTFIILGNNCTRNCAFCGVGKGEMLPPDPTEPRRIAAAVKKLGLSYVVITSVTRDDLPDGGAAHFAAVINKLQATSYKQYQNHKLQIEILIPDFQGNFAALKTVLDAEPYILNHNIETVPRLYPTVRPQADYRRSLELLRRAREISPRVYTKSGFMVGLGETKEEIKAVLTDLRQAGCNLVTIGQYLPPSKAHLQPARFVPPAEFEEYKELGEELGFLRVSASPFVRSSYHAREIVANNGISAGG